MRSTPSAAPTIATVRSSSPFHGRIADSVVPQIDVLDETGLERRGEEDPRRGAQDPRDAGPRRCGHDRASPGPHRSLGRAAHPHGTRHDGRGARGRAARRPGPRVPPRGWLRASPDAARRRGTRPRPGRSPARHPRPRRAASRSGSAATTCARAPPSTPSSRPSPPTRTATDASCPLRGERGTRPRGRARCRGPGARGSAAGADAGPPDGGDRPRRAGSLGPRRAPRVLPALDSPLRTRGAARDRGGGARRRAVRGRRPRTHRRR